MGRTYAGILGPLAMTVVIVRGLILHAGMEQTFITATTCLIAFGVVGFVVGSIAESTVDEAVRRKLEHQLAEFGNDP